MQILLGSLIFFSMILLILVFVPYYSDREMTKESSEVFYLKKSNYTELSKLFLSENWKFDSFYPTSLFSDKAYYHAGIIRFGNVGYLVNIIDYYRIIILQRRIRKTLPGFESYQKPYIK